MTSIILRSSSKCDEVFALRNKRVVCKEKLRLLQAWTSRAEAYAGSLRILTRVVGMASSEQQIKMFTNIQRAIRECEELRDELITHRAEHGC
jgi:hypothetical protein